MLSRQVSNLNSSDPELDVFGMRYYSIVDLKPPVILQELLFL
jgi:hypothetical protein